MNKYVLIAIFALAVWFAYSRFVAPKISGS